tara:strand:+ start:370 stop:576 length:207 start_codon:yes stop_codon:yes gene_type:complete
MAIKLEDQISSMRESFSNRISNLEKKVRSLMEQRMAPATKKELRDYIAWSMQQKLKSKKVKKNAKDSD